MKIVKEIVKMLPSIIEALVQLIPQLIISVVSICKEKIKRFFGILSPSAAAAKNGYTIFYGFNSGIQKHKCEKVNSIYQPYEISRAIILPSYGNVEYIVRAFEWTKRELLFD